jgi:hypothetical protein
MGVLLEAGQGVIRRAVVEKWQRSQFGNTNSWKALELQRLINGELARKDCGRPFAPWSGGW